MGIRITGVSVPWGFGVSWEYRESDASIVRRVLTFLEGRRILYEPLNTQIFNYVGQSATDIKEMLTQESSGPAGELLTSFLKEIRRAVIEFKTKLERIEQSERSEVGKNLREEKVLALGEMRGRVNPVLALLAAKYEIEVEPELAAVLQPSPE
jgi:hypothetical protein